MRKNGLSFYKKMFKKLGFSLIKHPLHFSSSLTPARHTLAKKSSRGDVFMTSLVFLFILIGTLRLCNIKTIHESKLTSIFVQETQGFYLLENLMHLARDYAYQIVQNPREPHLFLSASAYRTKDKISFKKNDGTYNDGWVTDFNGSLSKQQIVPDDFPLQIFDNGWEIRGGPIFWQDNKKNENDERYLAEVFMVGSLHFTPNLIPDWTMYTVQTMEIERNPLCDFQLYVEGDVGIEPNITGTESWHMEVNGPVQINGNTRFRSKNGEGDTYINFRNKFNCAGHTLYMNGNAVDNYILPKKYHMYDNHENHQVTYGTGGKDGYYFNQYAINYGETSVYRLAASHNNYANIDHGSDMYKQGYHDGNYESYERCTFALYRGNFTTRSRVYRPMGFDPGNYWGFWEPSEEPYVNTTYVDRNERIIEECLGFHNLAETNAWGNSLYSKTNNGDTYNPYNAICQQRGLTAYQATEKVRLVEMQKPTNFPSLLLFQWTTGGAKNEPDLYVPNNFIYSTYILNAFPPTNDNIYLNRYLNLVFQNNSILSDSRLSEFYYNKVTNTQYYYNWTTQASGDVCAHNMFMCINSNKTAHCQLSRNASGNPDIQSSTIAKIKSNFSPTGHGDDACPPHQLADYGTYWALDNYVTRITGEHYNFIYDRNRAKWIQLMDIDVSALTTTLNSDESWNNGTIMPILNIISYWQGKDAFRSNKNYKLADGTDIRYEYSTNRTTFFTNYANGSYTYPCDATHPPVIDIGVRLINASTLPNKGLTIYCPYPLYIKGNFNTNTPKPALIVTDSLTLLPDYWQDWRSQTDLHYSHLWYGPANGNNPTCAYRCSPYYAGAIIYADIMTGRTHPHFWIQTQDTTSMNPKPTNQTKDPNPDMGIHDAFRTICNFWTRCEFHGSLMLPYFCQEQWEPPIDFCKREAGKGRDPWLYAPINIDMRPRADVGIPAAMPFYYRINRGRKTHCIGKSTYNALIGDTLYGKNWHNTGSGYNFSDYHSALPNYLKYEVAPE